MLRRSLCSSPVGASSNRRLAATSAGPSGASPFADLQEHMRRSYKLDTVLQQTPHGMVLGKQENTTTYSFVGFEGVRFQTIAECMMRVPVEHRTFHAICGRAGVPCDFFGDIDLPNNIGDSQAEHMLVQSIGAITSKVDLVLSRRGVPTQRPEVLLLRNIHAATKKSMHLHIRFPTACFSDFRSVRHVAEKMNGDLDAAFFDLSCYRERGMIRLAHSRKVGSAVVHHELVPVADADNKALSALLEPSRAWSAAECIARSFSLREECLLDTTDGSASSPILRMDTALFQKSSSEAGERGAAAAAEKKTTNRGVRCLRSSRRKPKVGGIARLLRACVRCRRRQQSRTTNGFVLDWRYTILGPTIKILRSGFNSPFVLRTSLAATFAEVCGTSSLDMQITRTGPEVTITLSRRFGEK
jgi:hypothetical protein